MKKILLIALAVFLFTCPDVFAVQRLEPLAQYFTNAGLMASGYKLFVYKTGTSTKASLYKNAAKSSTHTNPVILNSAGRPTDNYPVYIDEQVDYKLYLSTEVDPPIGTPIYSVTNYTGVSILPDSAYYYASNYSTIALAAAAVNALDTDCTLVIDEDSTLAASLAFDAEVFLKFAPGNTITTTGYTLTIDSPANIIAQPNQQIFAGTGTVTFTNPGADYPGWWYSGSGSYHTAINYADASLPATGSTVCFPDGTYNCTAQVTPTSNHTWKAQNKWQAKLVQQTTNTNLIYINDKDNVVIDGLYLEGDDTFTNNGRGVYVYESCNHITVENCYITKMGRTGIVVQQSASGNEPSDIVLKNNTIIENQGNGIFYNSVNGGEISGNFIKANGQSVGTTDNVGFGIVLDCYYLVDGCYDISVTNNQVIDNGEGGIQALGCIGCIFDGNTVADSGDGSWDSPTAWDLSGINLRYKTGGAGTLYPNNNIVSNNTVIRSYDHSIYLSGALYTTVTGNNILDGAYGNSGTTDSAGIFIEHIGGQSANGNLITGNVLRCTSASAYAEYGIYGDGLQACKIDSNEIYGFGDTAQIVVTGDGTYNTWGTSICNNTIYGVATEAATIDIYYFTDGIIDGNVIYNAGVYGIKTDANSTSNIIPQITNHIHSASTADFSISAPTTNNHIQERLLSITTVSFAADADTTLYTVPTGYRCCLTKAIVVAGADAGATTTISIGADGAETNFIPANTLSNLDAAYDSVIVMPVPNTTPTKTKSYAATTVIEAQVASHSGGATNTVYLYGMLY